MKFMVLFVFTSVLSGCAAALFRGGPIRHGVDRAYTQIEHKGAYDKVSYVVAGDHARPFGIVLGTRLGYALSTTPIGSGSGLVRDAYMSYVYAFKQFAVGVAGGASWTTAHLEGTRSADVWGFPIDLEVHYGIVPRAAVYGGVGRWLASSVTARDQSAKTGGAEASADSTTTRGRGGVAFNLRQGRGEEWDVTLRIEGQYTHAAGGPLEITGAKVQTVGGLKPGQTLSMDSTGIAVDLLFTSF